MRGSEGWDRVPVRTRCSFGTQTSMEYSPSCEARPSTTNSGNRFINSAGMNPGLFSIRFNWARIAGAEHKGEDLALLGKGKTASAFIVCRHRRAVCGVRSCSC